MKKGASVGSGATILSNVTIGENVIIGAGSVVTKDVPPNAIVAGNPAKFIRSTEMKHKNISPLPTPPPYPPSPREEEKGGGGDLQGEREG